MYQEARELYNYVTNTEPFCSRIENIRKEGKGQNVFAIREIVRDAIGQYCKDYASNICAEIFSNTDFYTVSRWIEANDEDFIKVYKFLNGRGIEDYCIIPPNSNISFRSSNNNLEIYGVTAYAYMFLKEVITKYIPEEKWSMDELDNNLSAERAWTNGVMGRFDCYENIKMYDTNERYEIGAFCITAANVVAEIWDMQNDKVVAYVSLR